MSGAVLGRGIEPGAGSVCLAEHLLKQGGLGGALFSIECSEGVSRETHLGRDVKEGAEESWEAGGPGALASTLALPGTGDGGVLSRGAALASEFTTDPRAQTEAERPVAEGMCPDRGQRVCTLDRDGGGDGARSSRHPRGPAGLADACGMLMGWQRRGRSQGWSP